MGRADRFYRIGALGDIRLSEEIRGWILHLKHKHWSAGQLDLIGAFE